MRGTGCTRLFSAPHLLSPTFHSGNGKGCSTLGEELTDPPVQATQESIRDIMDCIVNLMHP